MSFGFVTYDRLLFSNLSDERSVLYSAERDTIIAGVIICSRSEDNNASMRINLQTIALLEDPVQQAFYVHNVLIQKNESMNLLALKDQNNEPTPMFLKNGDNLVCYSNGYTQKFDCTLYFRELTDLNDEI